jgi:hypothetical protein
MSAARSRQFGREPGRTEGVSSPLKAFPFFHPMICTPLFVMSRTTISLCGAPSGICPLLRPFPAMHWFTGERRSGDGDHRLGSTTISGPLCQAVRRGAGGLRTACLPISSEPVLQQPSRKNPVKGLTEQSSSRPPNTFLGDSPSPRVPSGSNSISFSPLEFAQQGVELGATYSDGPALGRGRAPPAASTAATKSRSAVRYASTSDTISLICGPTLSACRQSMRSRQCSVKHLSTIRSNHPYGLPTTRSSATAHPEARTCPRASRWTSA